MKSFLKRVIAAVVVIGTPLAAMADGSTDPLSAVGGRIKTSQEWAVQNQPLFCWFKWLVVVLASGHL